MSSAVRFGEVVRFGAVGVLATGVHAAAFALLVELGRARAITASMLAFLVALTVSYAGHRYWTFASAGTASSGAFTRFFATALLGLGLSAGSTFVIVDAMGASYRYALGFVVLAVPLSTFALSKFWVFQQEEKQS